MSSPLPTDRKKFLSAAILRTAHSIAAVTDTAASCQAYPQETGRLSSPQNGSRQSSQLRMGIAAAAISGIVTMERMVDTANSSDA